MDLSDSDFLLKEFGMRIDFAAFRGDTKSAVDYARKKIKEITASMEESDKDYSRMNEDTLSSIIEVALNQSFFFHATREQNSKGHVDITITAPNCLQKNQFCYKGEAKIWSGPKYALRGFDQLMGYLTRHPNGFCMFYFQTKKCDPLFADWPPHLHKTRGGKTSTLEPRFATTNHVHTDSGSQVEVDHYAAHFPVREKP